MRRCGLGLLFLLCVGCRDRRPGGLDAAPPSSAPSATLRLHRFGGMPTVDVVTTVMPDGTVVMKGHDWQAKCQDGGSARGLVFHTTKQLSTAELAELAKLLDAPAVRAMTRDREPPDGGRVYGARAPAWDGVALEVVVDDGRGTRSTLFDEGTRGDESLAALAHALVELTRTAAMVCDAAPSPPDAHAP